jgi:Stigma-specific protein, Stig1
MEEGEKKPDAGTLSGSPQMKIVYAIIAVAIVILAVVLIAKFGFNTDLLNPAGGQMSLVQRPPVTIVRPNVTTSGQQPRMEITPAFQRVITDIIPPSCAAGQSICNGRCVYLMTDSENCGTCENDCSKLPNVEKAACSNGKCGLTCRHNYADCNHNPSDGCEVYVLDNFDNCGSCGNICQFDHGYGECSNGQCVFEGCNIGYMDCNHNPSDGCEVHVMSDNQQCGGCGPAYKCRNSKICYNGCCQDPNNIQSCESLRELYLNTPRIGADGYPCPVGYMDCNNESADGCEVNWWNDENHCGGCEIKCSSVAFPNCIKGECTRPCDGYQNLCPAGQNCNGGVCQ